MSTEKVAGVFVSVVFWSYLALSSAVLWPFAVVIWAVSRPFDPRLTVLHKFTCWWGYHYIQLNPLWNVEIEGSEKLPSDAAAVIVANHQSAGDILMLFGLRRHFKWVSKASVFRVPFIGWNMRLNDYVGLRRGNTRSIARMMDDCRRHLRAGSSVMMFPEGTRSPDGEIKRFLAGAFALASEEEVPVIPVVLDGTMEVLPKRGLLFRGRFGQRVTVRVLDPIGPDPTLRVGQLRKLVRDRMVEALREGRGQAGSSSASQAA